MGCFSLEWLVWCVIIGAIIGRLTAAASPLMRGVYVGVACAMLLAAWFLTEISMRI
jgi:hypothetical protein